MEKFGGIEAIISTYGRLTYAKVKRLYTLSEETMQQIKEKDVTFVRAPPEIGVANYVDEKGTLYILIPKDASQEDIVHEIQAVLLNQSHEENSIKHQSGTLNSREETPSISGNPIDDINTLQEIERQEILKFSEYLGVYFQRRQQGQEIIGLLENMSESFLRISHLYREEYKIKFVLGS